ncbi:rolling circle replication-associated protein [Riemerella anatipestifer]|uniref:rolling circle replication-associated protein n=1 Tax=Riemerella anatipestifer TaxID=34085 RepID=UPI001BD9379B|nr:hypothetical protein [Riemerella anatipestifer]MBT0550815.1 hypothetical protein [Riemerella anatipestifer]MBT0553471.1 hypothetical protein [Riemerella anatipestifer]MCE3024277.1 hypothetical protein [Riemerella anatipestifer]MCU7559008.1 hypothetical protein [Riemerella anatipestifer]MDY3448857.1 hypothetical protein [Riemerella anatipestifer]
MFYQLSRLGLTEIRKKNINSQFGGSSKYKAWDNQIITKEKRGNKTIIQKMEDQAKNAGLKDNSEKLYQLKKSKIRNKILNFFTLNASKKFCAFYTITFPFGIDDDIAYKLLNTWLTRCRKECGLKSYLWVAERQKNGTLHFHLITNNYMKIGTVNEFMKTALSNAKNKGEISCRKNIIQKYNGVDVDNLYYPKKRKGKPKRLSGANAMNKLAFYLTKYVTKNDTKSNRLPWHCSRDISALFVSINYQDISTHEIANLISDNPEAVLTFNEEYFTYHYFLFKPSEFYFEDLRLINEVVYNKYHLN